jgi:hypothetical protein
MSVIVFIGLLKQWGSNRFNGDDESPFRLIRVNRGRFRSKEIDKVRLESNKAKSGRLRYILVNIVRLKSP